MRASTALRSVVLALCATGSFAASAAVFKSIGNDPAILYDAPTLRATRLFAAPRGMPLEIIVAQGDWLRVRDSSGGLSWVEKKAVVDRRTVTAKSTGTPVEVYAAPAADAPVVYRVQPSVLLEVTGSPAGGWVPVRHRDGAAGYVKASDVWGT